MASDTLLRVGTKPPRASTVDFSGALRAMRRRVPAVVAPDGRSVREREGVGEINQPAHLVSRLDGRRFVLPIRFNRRFLFGDASELTGSDETGLVSVHLTADHPGAELRFRLTAEVPDSARPFEILPFAQLLRCAQHGATIDLVLAGRTVVGSVTAFPDEDVSAFDAYVELLERMDLLQRMTGSSFPMPSRLSSDEVEELDVALRLLSGDEVSWNWASAHMTMTVDPQEQAALQSSRMEVELSGEYFVEIAGRSVLLGEISQRFVAGSIKVAPSEVITGEFDVELKPGDDKTASARLTSRAHFDPYDRSDRERVQLSADDLQALEAGSGSLASQVRG